MQWLLAEQSHDLARTILKSDDVDRFSLYISRNLVMATKNERMLQEMGLRGPSNSARVIVLQYEVLSVWLTTLQVSQINVSGLPKKFQKRLFKN